MDSYALLEKLCNIPGVTGFESSVREAIAGMVAPFVDETRVDTLGNLIATRRGRTGFTLMLDAHMDEIGFLVQRVDREGFIGLSPIGGWDERLLPSHMLTVITRDGRRIEGMVGTQPPHILKPADREKVIPLDDLFLDIGAGTAEEAAGMGVHVGDPVIVHYPFRRIGKDTVMGKALDDRAGCAVIIKALEALQGTALEATIVAAFVVGEERGMIGARTISPDTYVNIMDQYRPCFQASTPPMNRRITPAEFEEAVTIAREEGIHRLDWISA